MFKKFTFILSTLLVVGTIAGCNKKPVDPIPDPPTPIVVRVESVSLNINEHTMNVNDTFTLQETVLPVNADDKSVTWSVNPSSGVVTVDKGVVKGIAKGDATVTVTTNDGGKTAQCLFHIEEQYVPPVPVHVQNVSLNHTHLTMNVGDSETLTATVLPSDADDKSVTWSVSPSGYVSVVDGYVTAIKPGTNISVTVTTNDGGKTAICLVDVNELPPVIKTIKSYVVEDEYSLMVWNPFQAETKGGEYKEITEIGQTTDFKYFICTYGYNIRISLQKKGYIIPTGVEVDGVLYKVDEYGFAYFNAVVDDPEDEEDFYLSIKVKFENTEPVTDDYALNIVRAPHLTVEAYKEDQTTKINGTHNGMIVYLKAKADSENYVIKSLAVWTIGSDTGSHNNAEVVCDVKGSLYHFKTPFAYDSSKVVNIVVEEKDMTAFKGHDLVGDYMTIRSYGLSNYDTYVNNFQDGGAIDLTFDESGEIDYLMNSSYNSGNIAYANKAENGIINASNGTSSFEFNYAKNIIVLGVTSSGGSLSTPLTNNSKDVIFAVKKQSGSEISDYSICSQVLVIDGVTYCVITVNKDNAKYVSCYLNVNTREIIFDIDVVMYFGETIRDDKAMCGIYKDENYIVGFSYKGDGGKNDRTLLTSPCGVYHNEANQLIIPNKDEAIYNGENYVLTLSGSQAVIKNSKMKYTITLNTVDMSFNIVSSEAVVVSEVDFRGYTFVGKCFCEWDEINVNVSVVFDSYESQISGTLYYQNGVKYFFKFTASFNADNYVLTCTITDEGYSSESRSLGNVGKVFTALISEQKMTFKSNFGTNLAYTIKNGELTCEDFHL